MSDGTYQKKKTGQKKKTEQKPKSESHKVIPQYIEPRKFVAQSVVLIGAMDIGKVTRLSEASAMAKSVSLDLNFGYDEERRRVITGTIQADLSLLCQRCLEPMAYATEVDVSWAVVWDEDQAKQLPKRLDPWIAGEDTEDLYAMVEEELLLALPTAPAHETLCIDSSLLSSGEPVSEVSQDKKNNPFQALEALKGKTKH